MVKKMKKGFTLIELLIVVVIVGILALAAIPLITSNTRDARRAEGEQLMGSARDFSRVEYSKAGVAPANLAGAGTNAFKGKYYTVDQTAGPAASGVAGYDVKLQATPTSATDGTGTIHFVWTSGNSSIQWP